MIRSVRRLATRRVILAAVAAIAAPALATDGSDPGSPGSQVNNYYTQNLAGNQTLGAQTTFNLIAQDVNGNTVTSYNGTAAITTGDPTAILPPNPTFVAGVASNIPITFNSLGGYIVSSADVLNPAIGDSAPVNVVAAPIAAITTPSVVSAGTTGLTASVPAQDGMTYAWTIANGVITAGDGTNSITYSTVSAGALDLQCVVTNPAGATATGNFRVSVRPVAVAITAPPAATTGATGLSASVQPVSGATYSWSIANGTITSGATTPAITFTAGAVGSLGLSCTVTPWTGGGVTGSTSVNVVAPPATPAPIQAASPVLQGGSGSASVTARSGYTYFWTVTNGTITSPGGASGVLGSGVNSITYTAGAPPAIQLSCVEINAAGTASSPASASVTVAPSPQPPPITAPSVVTTGDTGITASVPARSGMLYNWSLTGGTITSPGGAAGVLSGGTNSISFTAGPVGTLTLSCTERNSTITSSPSTANVSVVGPPQTPTISTVSPVTAGDTGRTASVTTRAGMTYFWTISGGTITSDGGSSGVMSGGVGGSNTITFSIGPAGTLTVTCAEVNAANRASSPGVANITVQPPANSGAHYYFVAHQDDDLLFINPDVINGIRAGRTVQTTYVTAGDAGQPASYWMGREDSVRNAYATMANVANNWNCATQTYLTNKRVVVCRLASLPRISLAFMRLPDGGLLSLWSNQVPTLTTVDGSSVYSRAELINVLATIISQGTPARVGTLDSTGAYGSDHNDHVTVGFLTLEAEHRYTGTHELRIYRGYSMWEFADAGPPLLEQVDLSQEEHDDKVNIMIAYGAGWSPGDPYDHWDWRRYAISKLSGSSGPIGEAGGRCIEVVGGSTTNGTPVQAATCVDGSPQRWTVTNSGLITGIAGKCLQVGSDGVSAQIWDCLSSAAQKWTVSSNGQIRGFEGSCLTLPSSGPLQVLPCAVDQSQPRYMVPANQQWIPQFTGSSIWSSGTQFSDADVGSASTYYNTFQLADVNGDGFPDACVRKSDGIYCALNNRAGGFSAYTRYTGDFSDALGWLGDQYGSTLQFADINGDGKADVCGRSASGIYCAVANPTGTAFINAIQWTSDFSDAQGFGSAATYYRTVRLADVNGDGFADVCARSPTGIRCALNDRTGRFSASTLWLGTEFTDALGWTAASYGTTIQFADIDGDGRADVCGRGAGGVRCALANTTGNGFARVHQWSFRTEFSDTEGWAAASGYYGSIRLADVNGDGLPDLCGRGPSGIVCAISNGIGFDHAELWMRRDYTDAAGWQADRYGTTIRFADVNRDGHADVCGRGSSGLSCSLAP